jgi:prepilin-type N-terminal cleavage/methylation domain-containing protein
MQTQLRKAFTIIELMIVVAIIAVLIGLVVPSLRTLSNSAKSRETRQNMENLRAMMKELELQGGLVGLVPAGPITVGVVNEDAPGRYGPAVVQTSNSMARMRQIPANKRAIEQWPPTKILRAQGGVTNPVLLDGWYNPIIIVPPEGLNVTVGGASRTIVNPEGKPFFASAGPDADFGTGDDNVYSIEN